jgi:hypothetical protein
MRQLRRICCGAVFAVVLVYLFGPTVETQAPAKTMRVGGEIGAADETAGTVVVKTSSGPNMTVRPPQGARGRGAVPAVGSSVVVQFNQSAAQGVTDSNLLLLGVGGGRRPGIVEATSITPRSADFCGCSGSATEAGCNGSCSGTAPAGWTCGLLPGIVYPNVCGLQQP